MKPKVEVTTSRGSICGVETTTAVARVGGAGLLRITVPGWDDAAALDELADLLSAAHAAAVCAREATR